MRANKLMAVIHVVNKLQAFRNARVAFENGVDGVFLINHDVSYEVLLEAYTVIRMNLGNVWVGLNFLGISDLDAVSFLPVDADGFWLDNAGIQPVGSAAGFAFTQAVRLKVARERQRRNHIQYFGGVAFKYQSPVVDYKGAARLASIFVDVITTSGEGTGSPPKLEKILEMREGAPQVPIAIASGMTPENVGPFLDHVDYFLVATGISKSHTELDPARVYLMAKKMRR